jgi:hypothetical protein
MVANIARQSQMVTDHLTGAQQQPHLVHPRQTELGRGLINSQSNAAAGGRRMSAIGGIADIRGFWLAMVCPLMTQSGH